MTDRIVASGWWLVIMSMVTASGIAAVMLGYDGLLQLIAQDWTRGAARMIVAVAMGTLCALFCRHRNDLLV